MSLSKRSFCESILFAGAERRVVKIVEMAGLTLDENQKTLLAKS